MRVGEWLLIFDCQFLKKKIHLFCDNFVSA